MVVFVAGGPEKNGVSAHRSKSHMSTRLQKIAKANVTLRVLCVPFCVLREPKTFGTLEVHKGAQRVHEGHQEIHR